MVGNLIDNLPENERPESRGIQPILCRCCYGCDGSGVGRMQAGRSRVDPIDLYLLVEVRCGQAQSVPFWSGVLVPEWDRHRS